MKRFFIYAIVIGFLGNALLSNASTTINVTQTKLEALGV